MNDFVQMGDKLQSVGEINTMVINVCGCCEKSLGYTE